ncbi:MAG: hypothetical protein Q8916_07660 [Bacteroidota bacterium]|nr:hypothetical protein [Bacteroidota bacterium]MDP4230269.1 hypothetical protein [Bacteroidota bacterium]MDP4236115.1 hypothetical protein [Bacteroidota bacterium]
MISAWAVYPTILSVSVFSNPESIARVTIRVAVPRATPPVEMPTMKETNRRSAFLPGT